MRLPTALALALAAALIPDNAAAQIANTNKLRCDNFQPATYKNDGGGGCPQTGRIINCSADGASCKQLRMCQGRFPCYEGESGVNCCAQATDHPTCQCLAQAQNGRGGG